MSVDSGMGNRSADDDLKAIEEDTLPGTSNVEKVLGSLRKRLAQDNATNLEDNGLDNRTQHAELMTEPVPVGPLAELGINQNFNSPVEDKVPNRLNSRFHQASGDNPQASPVSVAAPPSEMPVQPGAAIDSAGATQSSVPTPSVPANTITPSSTAQAPAGNMPIVTQSFNKVAWVMENGEVKCASCETYFVPENEEQVKTAHCGFPGCADAEGVVDYNQEGPHTFVPNGNADDHFTLVAGKIEEGDVVDGDVVKTGDEDTKLASTEDYLEAFKKTATDSALYNRGYEDARAGKTLDEDLAELSDDYFHGYGQYQFYNKTPQESVPTNVYDIKPNSNLSVGGPLMQSDADSGPNELTDGHRPATASIKESLQDPKAFGQQLMADTAASHSSNSSKRMMMMQNAMYLQQQGKGTKAVCNLCKQLGHTDSHAMHESVVPQQGEATPPPPNWREKSNYAYSSKTILPVDVIGKFFED